MGFFTKLEKLSEKYIEGFFKTRFDNHIHPADIAKSLVREMREHKHVSVSAVYVPNEYVVFISQEDWAPMEPVKHALAGEMQEYLRMKMGVREYKTTGELKVSFEVDSRLAPGQITVTSSFSEALPDRQQEQPPLTKPRESTIIADRKSFYNQPAGIQDTITRVTGKPDRPKALLVKMTGRREDMSFPLGERSVLIGRKRTNEICLEDANVSRIHAAVDFIDGSFFITDLGSTNGTYVNGQRVSKKILAEGDIIRLGSTVLEFRMVEDK